MSKRTPWEKHHRESYHYKRTTPLSTCKKCGGSHLKTKGKTQQVCLICLRNYNRSAHTVPKYLYFQDFQNTALNKGKKVLTKYQNRIVSSTHYKF